MTHTTYTKTTVPAAVVALATVTLVAAPAAYAQINTTARLDSTLDAAASTSRLDSMVETNSSINTRANMDADTDGDAMVNTTVDADTNASLDADTDMFDNDNDSSMNQSTNGNSAARITVNGQLIDMDAYSGTGANVSGAIDSDEELAMYAQLVADTDANIEVINTSEQSVQLTYKEPARFLGMDVSSSRTATVTVNEDGVMDIQVSKPWWTVFVSGDTASNADIKAEIQDQLSMQAMSDVALDWDMQAQVIGAIETAMRIHVGAEAQAALAS